MKVELILEMSILMIKQKKNLGLDPFEFFI